MKRGDLFRLACSQKISRCLIGGRGCGLHIKYKGIYFCISEILGESCIYERFEQKRWKAEPPVSPIPWTRPLLEGLPLLERPGIEFKVYWRDNVTRSVTLLGKIVERRTKERKDNLRDLLNKANREFSERVPDPSSIFLLGP